jgi:hypothetical protein
MTTEPIQSLVLDLGCGKNKYPGSVGMDNVPHEGVDMVHDLLDFPYPFKEESIQKVRLSHVLEHFVIEDIVKILGEASRILRKDGELEITVPHVSSLVAFGDPTHRSFFTFRSFYFFVKDSEDTYYKSLPHCWRLSQLRASVNLYYKNTIGPEPTKSTRLENFCTRILNYLLRIDKTRLLGDLVVRVIPFYLVSIHCFFVKAPNLRNYPESKNG